MVYSVLGGVGPRAAVAPVTLSLENWGSHLWSSRRHGSRVSGLLRFQEHATSSWTNSPIWVTRKIKRSTERFLIGFVFFRFIRIKCQNACLMIQFSTNQMHIKSNETKIGGVSWKKFLVKMGPKDRAIHVRILPGIQAVRGTCREFL